ncbi:hypothetical protein [Pseudomonas fluorescens]|uniref:Uncharacterized protein n=1 Tax=Pseudomonas fluorescens TaxID=294 RepID=A0A109LGL0_PSEFL|nr:MULTISPECIES: hypothetical protein [Pseudomonas]KWV87160.1 hypothetical protein PFLmoz3_03007 [Pseudomonas fluorescens]
MVKGKELPILFSAPMVRAILEGRKTVTRRTVKASKAHAEGFIMLDHGKGWWPYNAFGDFTSDHEGMEYPIACPYGKPGDRLWVRESWQDVHPAQVNGGRYTQQGRSGIPGPPGVTYQTIYRADGPYPVVYHSHAHPYRMLQPDPEHGMTAPAEGGYTGWTPSIHMPRWASRIVLEITDVRVERLQDGEGETAFESRYIAEGINRIHLGDGDYAFHPFKSEPGPGSWTDPFDAWRELWVEINGAESWNANTWVWVVEFRRDAP